MAGIIDGKVLAVTLRKEIAAEAEEFRRKAGRRPRLTAVLVGDDPASHVYVRNKMKACEEVGIDSASHELAASTSESDLLQLIAQLNASNEVDGILQQLPLPKQIDKTRVLDAISPQKDVDGLHPWNVGLLVQGRARLIACTPLGVIEMLKRSGVRLASANVVVLGRSDLVGKPVSLLLMHENATVTICHSKTRNLPEVVREADIVIAAMGQPGFVNADFLKQGAVVVDVGTTVLKSEDQIRDLFGAGNRKVQDFRDGKTVIAGDLHPNAYEKTSLYSPVPGGVGPLTITMLLRNTVRAALNSKFKV